MEMDNIRADGLQELDERFDQQRLTQLVPPAIVALAQKQVFVSLTIEAGDASAGLEQAGIGCVQRGEQKALDVAAFAQFLEQFIRDLLGAATHQFGMELTDQQN